MSNLKITRVQKSAAENVDFNNIPFGKIFTDHMYVADYIDGEWRNMEIVPLKELSVHPGNLAWHYGQSIFEGMKATRDAAGTPLLFRPEEHIYRLNASARRMCMPEFPEEAFLEAVHTLVRLEKDWIPPQEGSALYIRPFMVAMDSALGVRPSQEYKFIICTLPVGPYYAKPIKLKAEETYIRAALGGVGEAKTAGNYAASLYPTKLAIEEGYDQIMWLDAQEFKYIQEVGTMNIFFVIGDEVITPETEGTILKGITRKSIIELLRDAGHKVSERRISIDEVMDAADSGELKEIFGTGTAAVIAKVSEIKYQDRVAILDTETYDVADYAKKTINGLRNRTIADSKGWVIEAGATVQV